jgi:hypothetical protein
MMSISHKNNRSHKFHYTTKGRLVKCKVSYELLHARDFSFSSTYRWICHTEIFWHRRHTKVLRFRRECIHWCNHVIRTKPIKNIYVSAVGAEIKPVPATGRVRSRSRSRFMDQSVCRSTGRFIFFIFSAFFNKCIQNFCSISIESHKEYIGSLWGKVARSIITSIRQNWYRFKS